MQCIFDNIRAEIARKRLTIDEFCQLIGIRRESFYRWERRKDLPCSVLMRIAEKLDVSPDVILGLSRGDRS